MGEATFPPLRHTGRLISLPSPLTSLYGREDLIAGLVEQLCHDRLVTLVGVGGVGKTRVAVAAARELVDRWDVVVFVDLTLAAANNDVLTTVGRAMAVTFPSRSAFELALTGRRALLIIDNCEHVLDGAADVAEMILETSNTSTVLATSREPLGIAGEHLITVNGLIDTVDMRLFAMKVGVVSV